MYQMTSWKQVSNVHLYKCILSNTLLVLDTFINALCVDKNVKCYRNIAQNVLMKAELFTMYHIHKHVLH